MYIDRKCPAYISEYLKSSVSDLKQHVTILFGKKTDSWNIIYEETISSCNRQQTKISYKQFNNQCINKLKKKLLNLI